MQECHSDMGCIGISLDRCSVNNALPSCSKPVIHWGCNLGFAYKFCCNIFPVISPSVNIYRKGNKMLFHGHEKISVQKLLSHSHVYCISKVKIWVGSGRVGWGGVGWGGGVGGGGGWGGGGGGGGQHVCNTWIDSQVGEIYRIKSQNYQRLITISEVPYCMTFRWCYLISV